VVQEGDRRCEKSTLNDLAYLTPLRIPLMNPVINWPLGCGLRVKNFIIPQSESKKSCSLVDFFIK
jgi:hypothetical protein